MGGGGHDGPVGTAFAIGVSAVGYPPAPELQ